MRKYILVLYVLLCLCITAKAQYSTDQTIYNFTDLEIQNYLFHIHQNTSNKIYNLIKDKKLPAFADSNLNNKISTEDFLKHGVTTQKTWIPNPANPDNIYDLIDTFFYISPDPYSCNFSVAEKKFIYKFNQHDSVFIPLNSLLNLLDSEEKEYLNFFIYKGCTENFSNKHWFLSALVFKEIRHKIFELTGGKINAYNDNSLNEKLTPDEARRKMEVAIITKQIQNPQNPPDPYDLIDSTFYTVMTEDSITRLFLLNRWELGENFTAQTRLFAIAPAYQLHDNGITFPHRHVFWVRWDDLKKHFSPEELDFYQYIFFYALKKSGDKTGAYTPMGSLD